MSTRPQSWNIAWRHMGKKTPCGGKLCSYSSKNDKITVDLKLCSYSSKNMMGYDKNTVDLKLCWKIDVTTVHLVTPIFWVRPYYGESTTSRSICEVKHRQAQLVLRWAITRESWVLYSFFGIIVSHCHFFGQKNVIFELCSMIFTLKGQNCSHLRDLRVKSMTFRHCSQQLQPPNIIFRTTLWTKHCTISLFRLGATEVSPKA